MYKIAICGIDGAGKSVLIENLYNYYKKMGITVEKAKVNFFCKESCQQAKLSQSQILIRIGMVFDFINYYSNFKTDCELILCDRFDVCYKVLNHVDKLDDKLIQQLDILYSIIEDADLYIYLELPVNIAANRLETRGNREFNESDEVLGLMQSFYKNELSKKRKVIIIDASQTPEIVCEKAVEAINLMRGENNG